MDIKKLAVEMLMKKMGNNSDQGTAESALSGLVGRGNDFDIGSLVGQLTGAGGDISSMAKSWLGDGGKQIYLGQPDSGRHWWGQGERLRQQTRH